MDASGARCGRCGSRLTFREPEGLCPGCLLEAALTGGGPGGSEGAEGGAPPVRDVGSGSDPRRGGSESWRSVGNYDLEDEIGRGGMGVVFRARQRGLNRVVAVKMVRAGEGADAAAFARFRVEAELVARLRHPHIVQIHEIGEFEGRPFYSMEYVEGRNLEDRVRERPMPVREAARWIRVVAEAVEHAHRQGVLHRDLKPSNIMIDTCGEPRVLDFGLARPLAGASVLSLGTQVLGSPGFSSPEQLLGRHDRAGPGTDVYSLGAVLYFLLAGRSPYQAETLAAVVRQMEDADPTEVRVLNPLVPLDLSTVCHHCLERLPARRYPTAAALAEDLTRFLSGRPVLARPVRWPARLGRWCRRRPVVAGLSGALVVLSLALILGAPIAALRIDAARRAAEREGYAASLGLARAHLEQGSTDVAASILERCPPAYRHWEWGYLAGLCRTELVTFRIPWPTRFASVALGPEGRLLRVIDLSGALRIWDAFSTREIPVFPSPGRGEVRVRCAEFSPRGERLAAGAGSGEVLVWRWDGPVTHRESGPGREAGLRLERGFMAHSGGVNALSWSEGGRGLVTAGEDGWIRVWDVGEGLPKGEVRTPWRRVVQAGLSPMGDRIVGRGETESAVWERASGILLDRAGGGAETDPGTWHDPSGRARISVGTEGRLTWSPLGGVEHELIRIRGEPGSNRVRVEFSPDGRWFCNAGDWNTARVWRVEDGAEQLVLPGRVFHAVFSPDGRRLATLGAHAYADLWDVEAGRRLQRLQGHAAILASLAFDQGGGRIAAWDSRGEVRVWPARRADASIPESNSVWAVSRSADGRRAAWAARYEGVTVWDLERGRREVRLRTPLEWVAGTAFSPEGTRLVSAGSHRRVRVWEVGSWKLRASLEGHDRCVLGVTFSRDGSRLLSHSVDGVLRLWDTRDWRLVRALSAGAEPVMGVALSADGRWLAAGDAKGVVRLWAAEASGPEAAWLAHSNQVYALAFSPDGSRLVTSGMDGTSVLWDRKSRTRVAAWVAQGCEWPVVFSDDGRRLFAGTTRYDFAAHDDPRLVVRDAADGRELLSLEGMGVLAGLAYEPAGRRVVLGAFEGGVRVLAALPWTAAGSGDPGHAIPGVLAAPNRSLVEEPPEADPGEGGDPVVDYGWEPGFIPARAKSAGPAQIDLEPHYTAPLSVPAFPTFGPFNTDQDLRGLPAGCVSLGGVAFDVRGVIQLARTDRRGGLFQRGWERLPVRREGMAIGRRVRRLHVLHGVIGAETPGTAVGTYSCFYEGGRRQEFPLVYGEDAWLGGVLPAGEEGSASRRGRRVWQGPAVPGPRPREALSVFLSSYENPLPDLRVVSLGFGSTLSRSAPFLVAVTVEE